MNPNDLNTGADSSSAGMAQRKGVNLDKLLNPSSIAIIGASNVPHKVGNNVVKNLLDYGFRGRIYPINLKEPTILGLKAYKSVLDVPDSIDLAVVAIPARFVPAAVEECGRKGIPFVVVISAGFGELGEEGKHLEEELLRVAKLHNVRVLGPNCLGIINLSDNVNASFSSIMPHKGNIAFISQSGALCSSILSLSVEEDFGFSKFISIGNKIDIDESDLLEYLGKDPNTQVVLLYLESIRDGRRFLQVACEVVKQKPIILVKGGVTEAGAKAVSSHTGSMAGEDAVFDAALKQCGVIRVECLDELFDAAEIFSKVTRVKNENLLILTNGGGLGVITVDSCAKRGIRLAQLSESSISQLSTLLPGHANVGNPLDIIGDADAKRFEHSLRIVLRDKNVGMVLVIVTPQSMTEIVETAEVIIKLVKSAKKPIITNFIGKERRMKIAQELLNDSGIPNFEFPEMAINAIRMLTTYNDYLNLGKAKPRMLGFDKSRVANIISNVKSQGRNTLTLEEGFQVLNAFNIRLPPQIFSNKLEEHIEFFKTHGSVVLKVDSHQVLHKTDTGMVSKRIDTEDELKAEFSRLYNFAAGQLKGFKICAQVFVKGVELIVGGLRDAIFGPVVSVGIGGILTEIIRDIGFRVAPISDDEAEAMLKQLKGYKLLRGFRNMPPVKIPQIVEMLHVLSTLLLEIEEITEIEVNPLIAGEHQSLPVDILIKLS